VIQAVYPGYENGRLVVLPETDKYALGLRLSGIIENRELVVEAARPGSGETRTGRSVAVSEREIAQTAEIGIIEDVMSTVKLLPGVGYAGFFDAQPSIRGGDPGDMHASLDGFYIMNPYHWGGGYSIFDPRMVQSAQLSHGVFSSRYGYTISGLLDITSKKPSPTETEFELGVNTSTANFSLSFPFAGKGGLMLIGRVTYYDPIIWLAQQLAKTVDALEAVNSIRVAPYIRSGAITGNYRFGDSLELHTTGFWGMDGIGVTFENSNRRDDLSSDSRMQFDWTNYQGFFTAGLSWNPRNDMLLKFTAGTGYEESNVDGNSEFNIYKKTFSDNLINLKNTLEGLGLNLITEDFYDFYSQNRYLEDTLMVNAQGRIDYDWELGTVSRGDKGSGGGLLLAAAGVQEMFTGRIQTSDDRITVEQSFFDLATEDQAKIRNQLGDRFPQLLYDNLRVQYPSPYISSLNNKLFSTSAYALAEYNTPNNRFGVELGLRLDHYYLLGENFSIPFTPAVNPRLNIDFNVFKNIGIIQSFDISAGTGLFSSVNDLVLMAEKRFNIDEGKPNRSWTSVLGSKIEFSEGLNLNIEGYYKVVYDRMYIMIDPTAEGYNPKPFMDGEGRVWGIDAMLQKLQSRYWDGWISYSFSWAKYRNPGITGNEWRFPSYHRFHNLNLILNIKPAPRFNIYTRFGLASGVQISRRSDEGPKSYPIYVYDSGAGTGYFIEKFYWSSDRDENNRTTPSLPLDVKFSIIGKNEKGKTRYEVYAAVENVLALLYSAEGNVSYNTYTGTVDTGNTSASYEMPIPIPSFGFKMSY
jgi:hypothetical protein